MSEAAHQHGKKKRKADPEIDPEFQIAPMIDILLVLLVFFMSISTTEVLQANKDVRLPVAKEAKPSKDNPGQVIINITYTPINSATSIEVDQRVYHSPMELVSMLKNKVAVNPLVRVLIRADKEVKYEYLRQLLEAIGASGVGNVTFSVVDKEGGKPS
ncbi:MAG: biopolymer transporter ExbD [Terrimicrobiaceae bacterium]|nr:biopolymer transporter ExbD [Terrimicrobiaceae bacterium]